MSRYRPITENDLYLLREGTHVKLADILGSHFIEEQGGAHFAVWAPNASRVSVIGSFNEWNQDAAVLQPGNGGIWQGFAWGAFAGSQYKLRIVSRQGEVFDKADPIAFFHDQPPGNASVVWDLAYSWQDAEWMRRRDEANNLDAPISIYEVHLGSWRRGPNGQFLSYREIAEQLVPYVREMGFSHVEFMPVMEHPFYGSWGYQITGFFAPTSRYGTPQDLMYLIDELHRSDIGVILDWVPSHFPQDAHGLGYFDGAHEYEPADPRQGLHPDWNSFIFDYSRGEVRSFLLSSALFWLEQYHADGLRVDAVASVLYLDYSRKPGEWVPNVYGGRENLDAIGFLRRMNEDTYRICPGTQTFAEESTAWPMTSRPTYLGGLGFGFKWDMGWMHDTLDYMSRDPISRRYAHHELTFRAAYAFNENFVLPLSHDEVVYGKSSLLRKMPGDRWHKFANLRLLLAYMYAQPGKKLLFMGDEFAEEREWSHDRGLDWGLLEWPDHAGVRLLAGDLNHLYCTRRALHCGEFSPETFEWLDAADAERNILSFLRKGRGEEDVIAVICNFSPVPRDNYQVGVPRKGFWKELLNTDVKSYGGSGRGNFGGLSTVPIPMHQREQSLTVDLPPLAALYLSFEENSK
jgi:1,4-alpha-glucan branching enzyme